MLRKKSISALMLLIGLLQGVWPVICHLFTDILFRIHGGRKSKSIQLVFITFVACIRGSLPSEVEEEH